MASHSSILAWRIPWTEEPGGLQFMGSQRVRHDGETKHSPADAYIVGFPGGSLVKNPTAKQETQGRSLGREDPLEKEMAAHSSIPAWEILWAEEPGRLQSMGVTKSWTQLSD